LGIVGVWLFFMYVPSVRAIRIKQQSLQELQKKLTTLQQSEQQTVTLDNNSQKPKKHETRAICDSCAWVLSVARKHKLVCTSLQPYKFRKTDAWLKRYYEIYLQADYQQVICFFDELLVVPTFFKLHEIELERFQRGQVTVRMKLGTFEKIKVT